MKTKKSRPIWLAQAGSHAAARRAKQERWAKVAEARRQQDVLIAIDSSRAETAVARALRAARVS